MQTKPIRQITKATGTDINSQKKVDIIAPVILNPTINNTNKHNSVIIFTLSPLFHKIFSVFYIKRDCFLTVQLNE